MSSQSENVFTEILEIEKKRFEMLTLIEEARLKLQHEYAEKRAKLLSENKDIFSWLLDSLSELRKERINFQKKAISEISETLQDCKVPEDLTKEWLKLINKLYHDDVTVAQKMISVDFDEIDNNLFADLKEVVQNKLHEEIDEYLKKLKNESIKDRNSNCPDEEN